MTANEWTDMGEAVEVGVATEPGVITEVGVVTEVGVSTLKGGVTGVGESSDRFAVEETVSTTAQIEVCFCWDL
mgnify:CR=1 FL=1